MITAEQLSNYLKSKDLNPKEFALKIGIDRRPVVDWLHKGVPERVEDFVTKRIKEVFNEEII